MYDPLLDETMRLVEELYETKEQLDKFRRECKRLRKENEEMTGPTNPATPTAMDLTKKTYVPTMSKEAMAQKIREASENLREALQESLGHETVRVQMNLGGGHSVDQRTGKEVVNDFVVEVLVLDIQKL